MNRNSNDKNRYDDIINLPHHVSTTHFPMPMIDRAAQFSPFAALVGYDDAVKETARLTDDKIKLDEDTLAILSERLRMIKDWLPNCPIIQITYFKQDEKKAGGTYITKSGRVKKIDEYKRIVFMQDGVEIPIEEIVSIDGDVFDRFHTL